MRANVWADSCSGKVILIKELLQVAVTGLVLKWSGAPRPGEQTVSSEAGGGGNPNLACTFFFSRASGLVPSSSRASQALQAVRWEGPMSRKLHWLCSIACRRLLISWGTGEERTISVESEAIALENYSADGIKRRKQN